VGRAKGKTVGFLEVGPHPDTQLENGSGKGGKGKGPQNGTRGRRCQEYGVSLGSVESKGENGTGGGGYLREGLSTAFYIKRSYIGPNISCEKGSEFSELPSGKPQKEEGYVSFLSGPYSVVVQSLVVITWEEQGRGNELLGKHTDWDHRYS